ncbi:alpha/beta hydrolase-fold protein [Corynebacterium pyruviciproducens]
MNPEFFSIADCITAFSGDPDAARQFYHQQKEHGLPRVNPTTGEATFLWLEQENSTASAVHLRMNRISDKAQFARGLMHRIPGTTLWGITLELPLDLRASYGFCPIHGEIPTTTPRPQHGLPPAFIDPANATDTYLVKGLRGWSIYAGPQAPSQPQWGSATRAATTGGPQPRLHTQVINYGDAQRTVYTYVPQDTSRPLPVVTLTDADAWFPRLGLHHALDRAIAHNDLPPIIVTGPECVSVADRQHILGPNQDTIDWLSTTVLANAEAQAQRYATTLDHAHLILTGQSLGGMTTLATLLRADHPYTHFLAQSPSLWWSPENTTSPAGWSQRDTDWITEQLRQVAVPGGTPVTVTIGRQEGFGIGRVEKLVDVLNNRGWRTKLVYYNGGHDYAWWRGALFDQLRTILTSA